MCVKSGGCPKENIVGFDLARSWTDHQGLGIDDTLPTFFKVWARSRTSEGQLVGLAVPSSSLDVRQRHVTEDDERILSLPCDEEASTCILQSSNRPQIISTALAVPRMPPYYLVHVTLILISPLSKNYVIKASHLKHILGLINQYHHTVCYPKQFSLLPIKSHTKTYPTKFTSVFGPE